MDQHPLTGCFFFAIIYLSFVSLPTTAVMPFGRFSISGYRNLPFQLRYKMTIKVLVLKSGEDVIADVQEMMSSENQVMGYFLTKPCVVKLQAKETNTDVSVRMHPWMPFAREKMIPLTTDWVVTMVTPVESIQEMYEKQVLNDGKENDSTTDSDEQSETDNSD